MLLPLCKVDDAVACVSALAVRLSKAEDGEVVANLTGKPAQVPSGWLLTDAEVQHDVPYILEKADRYARLEGQSAVLVCDAEALWNDDWGELRHASTQHPPGSFLPVDDTRLESLERCR